MKEFMEYDFAVETIVLCLFLPKGKGDAVHKDRPSHGLALHIGAERLYKFDDGRALTVRDGDLIYLPKGSNYSVTTATLGECYAINFDISGDATFEPFTIHTKNVRDMLSSFEAAERSFKNKKQGYKMRCKEKLYRILAQLQKEYATEYASSQKSDLIAPAVTYIHEHYTEGELSVAELARKCNITPEYFRRIFGKIYGSSPIKYINDLKISHAKELLLSGEYSVSDAATLSGFSDISYFSREFKKATGVPPRQFN
ncbi:MAG: helix-turn-helix transcriptional regulator [Clostridia bacterium]|nr:helix-turn-helix transcriptional regulator [Clostridia bacterium]